MIITGGNVMVKERIIPFDFIRAICAIGIVAFHFFCHTSNRDFLLFYNNANCDWGYVIVNIFFILSGAAIYYNNSMISSLKKFYYKRWKSLFPMFYISFFIFFLFSIIKTHNVFYGGNPLKLLLTLFGLDGYTVEIIPNYYILGEWFLGAIIILYVLYPVVLKAFNKAQYATTIVCMALFILCLFVDLTGISTSRKVFSCLISFEFGMLIMKNRKLLTNKLIVIVSFVVSIIICVFKLPINANVLAHILSLSLFFVMYYIGNYVMKSKFLNKSISFVSKISYPIFLLQHLIILMLLKIYSPQEPVMIILWLIVTIAVTIVGAEILSLITNLILNSKWYLKLENRFLK